MHGLLQLRPSRRVVTTVTTTTVHYAPIEVAVPEAPLLSGDYRSDRQRYPLEMARLAPAESVPMPTMLGMADYAPASVPAVADTSAVASGSTDRKGKRRAVEPPEDEANDAKRRKMTPAPGLPPPSPGRSPSSDSDNQLQQLTVAKNDHQLATLLSLKHLVGAFATLSPSLQIHTLHQLLRQAPTTVVQSINSLIQPALKRDFVSDLPPELATSILGFLDVKDLVKCTGVNRFWKRFINGQEDIWKRLLRKEGLWAGPSNELERRECDRIEEIGTRRRNGRELSVRDLISMEDGRAETFLKRWRAEVWDEDFDEEEAAKPTEAKARASGTSSRGGATLRRTDSRPQISRRSRNPAAPMTPGSTPPPVLPREPDIDCAYDYISPYKLLYKKRKVARRHWYRPRQPHRVTFPALHSSIVTALQFDNDRLVIASDNNNIDVYNPVTGQLKMRLTGHVGGVWALQFIGNILVSGSTDRSTRIWDLNTGRCTHIFRGHTSTVRCLQIIEPVNVNPDPNGDPVWEPPCPLIVTGSRDTTIRVWKLPSSSSMQGLTSLQPYAPPSPSEESESNARHPYHLRCLRGHTEPVRAVAAHGRRLVSGSYDCTLRVWDLLTGKCQFVMSGHSGKVYSVTVDEGRRRCASGSLDGTVRIWSLDTGECVHRLDGHSSLVGLLENSLHYLVSAGADSTLKIWNPDKGSHVNTLSAHAGAITCFRHDDFRVVSGTDGQLRMWDIRRGRAIRDLMHDMNGVWQVSFSDRFVMAAVQRGGTNEYEILDFFPEFRPENASSSTVDLEDSPSPAVDVEDGSIFLPTTTFATPGHGGPFSNAGGHAGHPQFIGQLENDDTVPDSETEEYQGFDGITSEEVVGGSVAFATQMAEWEQVFMGHSLGDDQAGGSIHGTD